MVPDELLLELLPPAPLEYMDRQITASSEAEYRMGGWTQVVRRALQQQTIESGELWSHVRRAVFVGIGVSRVPWDGGRREGFAVVHGYQFGVSLLCASTRELEWVLEGPLFRIPVRELEADFRPHGSGVDDGRIAAYYDDGGDVYGVTARHVVDGLRAGRPAPVSCEHGSGTTMVRGGGPYIDAATVRLDCTLRPLRATGTTRSPRAGEQVQQHFASTVRSTTIVELQTPSQLLSAVMPQHFLTSGFGQPADSGALISSTVDDDMVGLYLGECTARDAAGLLESYGFAIDLPQAIDVLGITAPLAGATHA